MISTPRPRRPALFDVHDLRAASCLACQAEVWALEKGGPHWPVLLDRHVKPGEFSFKAHRCRP